MDINEKIEKNFNKIHDKDLINWSKKIWPFNRSLTGNGNRKTLLFLKTIVSGLKIRKVKSGTKVFDWRVPKEWHVKKAFFIGEDGKKYCDFSKNNLHLLGYSISKKATFSLKQLSKHIHTLRDQPSLIPYVTSYYEKNWGFCMSYNDFKKLKNQKYKVIIDTNCFDGVMNYGEFFISGKSKKEILFSTNICHPSMANNEISGIIVSIALAKILQNIYKLNYSYRFVFLPETVGSIFFIKKNLKRLVRRIHAGYVLSCVGDERAYSLISSRYENTISEKFLLSLLKNYENFTKYSFLDRGSDERQYCAPKVNLPMCGFSRSKYNKFPEYHTSADNFKLVTGKGMKQSLNILKNLINIFELSFKKPESRIICEPFMSKRKLYHNLSSKEELSKYINNKNDFRLNLNILSYCDGKNDLVDISNYVKKDVEKIINRINFLKKCKLIK